jgi:hypothetical protein
MARQIALDVARAEVAALTGAMQEAATSVLAAPDLPADEVGKGLRDVVSVFSSEVERRIPGWVSTGEARTGVDPDALETTVPTGKETDVRNQLGERDRKAIELAKMTRGHPELKEKVRKADDARGSKEPIEKMHPVSKMAEESAVLSEYEADVLELMSKEKISHEVAIGKIARDPAYHVLKANYRAEQRAMRDG